MPDALTKLLQPFLILPPARRWMLVGVVVVSLASFAVLIAVANRTDYRPLFANLNGDDAGEIVRRLKEQKVPYQLAGDGKAILVPADKVYDLRLTLASEGLPQGGGVGYEIFDRKNFGMTEFVQKLNYQRALQGELARTIGQLAGVEQARVHLAIPEKSLFKESEKVPTASVVLRMKANRSLRESEVQGIVHLVSSSIEGMDTEHVTVLDSRGKVLSKGGPTDPSGRMSSAMLEVQRGYERNLEERLQSLLDKVVGSGRSAARVTATFNFKQVEKFEERYDPETTAVRSEQRSEEKLGSTTATAGVPGVQTNLGRTAPAPSTAGGGGSKNDETLNYEVSRSTARTIEPVGTVEKVSVAVLVDGKYETPAAVKEGSSAKAKYLPRTPEELQKIEALIKSAVGFNTERGDQVTVANIPFQDTGEGAGPETERWWEAPVFLALLKNGLIAASFLALIFLVVRPLMRNIRSSLPVSFEPVSQAEDEVQKLIDAKRAMLQSQSVSQVELIEKVKGESYQAAQVLKNWLESKG